MASMVPKSLPFGDPLGVNDLPGLAAVKEFNELLVHRARLWVRETAVLVKDRGMRPLLQLAQTADQTPRAVLALVAVDQDRVVAAVEQHGQSGADLVVRD